MIDRYAVLEITKEWSEINQYQTWLEIEKVIFFQLQKTGVIPDSPVTLFDHVLLNLEEIKQLEIETKHDVVAFIFYVQRQLGEMGRWFHYGLTSSDIVDTGLAIHTHRSINILMQELNRLIIILNDLSIAHNKTPIVGRTHGMHAKQTTFGHLLRGYHNELARNHTRIKIATGEVTGKISGVLGDTEFLKESESIILATFNLTAESDATQIVARDRYAYLISVLALLASAYERFATTLRHLSRTEVTEVTEGFSSLQTGSSAMPHKKNPIASENICGISRLIRGMLVPAYENINLWHERDISHSSVERIMLPNVFHLIIYMTRKIISIVSELQINTEQMNKNLQLTDNRIKSEDALLLLIRAGYSREEAYRMVQKSARLSETKQQDFLTILEQLED